MTTHSTHSTARQATTPGDRLRAFLRPSGVQAMPRIASPAISPCDATQTPRMACGVAYPLPNSMACVPPRTLLIVLPMSLVASTNQNDSQANSGPFQRSTTRRPGDQARRQENMNNRPHEKSFTMTMRSP